MEVGVEVIKIGSGSGSGSEIFKKSEVEVGVEVIFF